MVTSCVDSVDVFIGEELLFQFVGVLHYCHFCLLSVMMCGKGESVKVPLKHCVICCFHLISHSPNKTRPMAEF